MSAAILDHEKLQLEEPRIQDVLSEEDYRKLDKRVTRKIDLHILPWIIVSYLLNYLDRTNLGNARTLNNDIPGHSMVEQLNLQGDKYLLIVAIFFIPYVLFEFPSNLLMKYFTPSRWISRIMVSWGIVTCCTAAVTTYEGLIACRIFLGVAEAGFFPGILCYLCFWYPPHIRGTRMAFFSASITIAGAFGGLIATGVSFMSGKGGLYGWQWLFILEGSPTIIVGVLIWFFLPDYPETATWFTDEERAHAIERMGPYAPKGTDKHFDKHEFFSTLKSIEFWCFSVAYFLMANSGNAFGYFTPTIVATLGYTGYLGQLMTVPPNVLGFFAIIGNSMWSDYRRERPTHVLGALVWVMTGWILLITVDGVGGRYVGVFMVACTNAAIIPFVGYLSSSFRGSTSTGIAMGGVVAIANLSGIVTPFVFPSNQAPRYYPGLWTLFAMLLTSALIVAFLWYRLGSSAEYHTQPEDAAAAEISHRNDLDGSSIRSVPAAVLPPPAELEDKRARA